MASEKGLRRINQPHSAVRWDFLPIGKGKKRAAGRQPRRVCRSGIIPYIGVVQLAAATRQRFRPDQASRRSRGRQDRFAPDGGLRPVLTAAARGAVSILRPGRRNGAPAELRNRSRLGCASNREVSCGRLTKLRIKRRLSLQKDTGQAKQSVCDTAQGSPV